MTYAYITLLTRPSYLAGAILLAHSLQIHSPSTPLIIAYTRDTLPDACVRALESEARWSNVVLRAVEHLRLPEKSEGQNGSMGKDGGQGGVREKGEEGGMVAERFADTWTKLRVFDILEPGIEYLCWLDADMLVFGDPSGEVFGRGNLEFLDGSDSNIDAYGTTNGTGHGHENGEENGQVNGSANGRTNEQNQKPRLMAVHTCVCNLDHDPWAPSTWTPSNCAITHLSSPSAIAPVSGDSTFANFNSGTFLFKPSPALSSFVRETFQNTPPSVLRKMAFPDQDFLNLAFAGRWKALSWRVNALKTWRYWHPNVWRDDEVAVLHYIVDKPWAARVGADGRAGYLGKDGVTHGWWWDCYEKWVEKRKEAGEEELVTTVGRYVVGEEGEGESEDLRAIGGGVQGWAEKWSGKKEVKEGVGRKALGERGHGPVVRERGVGRGAWSVMEA